MTACAVVALTYGASAAAQDTGTQDTGTQDTGTQAEAIEEMIVTGSRIRQNPLDAPAPVLSLSESYIDRTGLTSLGDVLQRLPLAGSSLNTRFNSSGNFGFSPDGGGVGAGAVEVALRHLEAKRTLVLVDGIRWISGASATGVPVAVDLNTIPTNVIERVEVLQDGASAIYGSDAIGGVVNVITQKDFEGLHLDAFVGGFIDEGDGETYEFTGTFGARGERTSVVFSAGYVRQERVSAADRAISAFPTPFGDSCDVSPSPCSSGTPQGRFIFNTATGQFANITLNDGVLNDGGTNIPQFDPDNPGTLDFNGFDNGDRFNFAQFNLVLTPNERVNVFAQATHELADWVKLYARGMYTNRQSVNQAAPEPIFLGPLFGSGGFPDTVSIDATNPFNPFGCTLNADTPAAGECGFLLLGRRPLEIGPRIFSQNVNTWYVGAGFQGEFTLAERNFFWDFNVAWAENRADQTKQGAINIVRVAQALGPVDQCAGAPNGCVPLNLFGGQGPDGTGSITQEMIDFFGFTQKDTSGQELFDLTVNVSGDVVDLPAGPLAFALGFEYRDQEGFFQPDAVVVAGESNGVPSSPTSGGFDVKEWYGELRIPLLADTPFADLLELSVAGRLSDYDTIGSDETFKVGLSWRPMSDLLFRGSISTGFRAPGIGELFSTGSSFDETLTDPCSDFLGLAGGPVQPQGIIDACIAQGVPADGSYAQPNPQLRITTGGNEDLDAETSDNYVVGAVYSPSWVDRLGWVDDLVIEANWYKIEVEDAIRARAAQDQLNACINSFVTSGGTFDETLCAGIGRNQTGIINQFNNRLINLAELETSGIDLAITYVSPDTDVGRFQASWSGNWLLDFTETFRTDEGSISFSREGFALPGAREVAFPEWRWNAVLDWFYENWTVSITERFVGGVDEFNQNDLDGNPSRLESQFYTDIQINWTPDVLNRSITATLGVNNLFDNTPPACFGCGLNSFNATLHDIPGIFTYFRLSYRR